ncbi:MAG: DNA-protecting protein DprA [Coxiella sp. (in: Bacteria)]|nr:MAG: DNA-protecting protein DprA [Coxiella sp. (in: g-proteobacteria)]
MTELLHWLTLHHALHGTPRTIQRLLNSFASPQQILDIFLRTPEQLQLTQCQRQRMRADNQRAIDAELTWLTQHARHHIITLADERYPNYLREIYDPPAILYIDGDPCHLGQKQLAIIGSRNPTHSAQENAHHFAAELSQAKLLITSGLAIGIDGCAHRGALSVNAPTIAVLGCGVDVLYPKRHRTLTADIINTGALVSEFPLGTQPTAQNFPRRNRLISGLALGTLVVEATVRSGSLITANFANSQGRDVFAIPGSIKNPLARGCHHLIRQGAKLTESTQDILEEYGHSVQQQNTTQIESPSKELDHLNNKLLECLSFEIQSAQKLIRLLGISAQSVRSRLLNLELRGYIKAVPGGYCRVKL